MESRPNKRYGLGLFDTAEGFRYLQCDRQSDQKYISNYYRGIARNNQNIYLATPHSILAYTFFNDKNSPLFSLQAEYSHYDWVLGSGLPPYAGLVNILSSDRRNRIFVGNNSQCSIDELTLSGVFVKRHSLWDISPDYFKLPNKFDVNFSYGEIRDLVETDNGNIHILIANCNKTNMGMILDFDAGEPVLNELTDPRGVDSSSNKYIIIDGKENNIKNNRLDGKLTAYTEKTNKLIKLEQDYWKNEEEFCDGKEFEKSRLKKIVIAEDKVFCGASFSPDRSEEESLDGIISFDITTGKPINSYLLPNLEKFRLPKITDMIVLPEDWHLPEKEKLVFYFTGKSIAPKLFQSVDKEKIQSNRLENNNNQKVVDNLSEKDEEKLRRDQQEKLSKDLSVPVGINDKKKPRKEISETKLPHRPISILLNNVSLCYSRTNNPFFSFKRNNRKHGKFWALNDVSATVCEGETIGLIGRNGSGKSTISMVISGALTPDKGKVTTQGKVQLLALGIGFRPQLTGRENVMISGAILGMPRKVIKERMSEIEEFAEIGEFFDEPLRTYSAGMKSRLGFAISTAVQPDILILDEVMSTGDASFRKKANMRMEQMRERTKTVVVVSHNPGQISELCSRVIWLEKGRVIKDGIPEDILPLYQGFCENPQKWLTDYNALSEIE